MWSEYCYLGAIPNAAGMSLVLFLCLRTCCAAERKERREEAKTVGPIGGNMTRLHACKTDAGPYRIRQVGKW